MQEQTISIFTKWKIPVSWNFRALSFEATLSRFSQDESKIRTSFITLVSGNTSDRPVCTKRHTGHVIFRQIRRLSANGKNTARSRSRVAASQFQCTNTGTEVRNWNAVDLRGQCQTFIFLMLSLKALSRNSGRGDVGQFAMLPHFASGSLPTCFSFFSCGT